ncbi:bactofilin family protein [Shimia thalassica]|uniref:bactofilin family protein n=1 Tax=Shimia thalassica TaxID=1715693 RepID=UPI002734B844|nr:polymer-forming cytoskeletal protein [Shimia thalassica]
MTCCHGKLPHRAVRPDAYVIAEGLQIFDNLSGTADIDVSGRVQGDIVGASVDVLAGGQVEGSVDVSSAHIRGHLNGSLKAKTVEIHAGAECNADIEASDLETRKGATIKGKLSIISQ